MIKLLSDNMTYIYLIVYFIVISFIAFNVFYYDKRASRTRRHKRVDEFTLIFLAIVGGSAGIFLGMIILNHKTRKMKFKLGIPIILIFQIFGLACIYFLVK